MRHESQPLGLLWIGAALRDERFLISMWPWRVAAHVSTTALLLLALTLPATLAMLPLLVVADSDDSAALLTGVVVSMALLAAVLVVFAPVVARVEMARLSLVDRRPRPRIIEPAHALDRWRHRLTERSAWLRVVHLATLMLTGPAILVMLVTATATGLGLVVAPLLLGAADSDIAMGPWTIDSTAEALLGSVFGAVVLAACSYLCGGYVTAQVVLARQLLLDPTSRYEERLGQLTRSRARLVHGFDAERRRIERDLHDVAQQRVVTLTMQLGLAEMDLRNLLGTQHRVTRELGVAHHHATELMAELRSLIHGIHPQVLTDLGVGSAVEHLASTMPLPVRVHDFLEQRPARHVESTLYFCLNEAISNAARHSGADTVTVTLRKREGYIVTEVCDDGRGGADSTRGTGLSGMADRAAVLEGEVTISSPPGGPTLLRIVLPDDHAGSS